MSTLGPDEHGSDPRTAASAAPAAQDGAQRSGEDEVRVDDALPDLDNGEWSLWARVAIAAAVAAVSIGVVVHLGMVFLHVAPSNTVSRQYDKVIDDYIYPEFEQNWKLFAPNPLQQNVAVHARAQVVRPDGQTITTGWVDLSKQDGESIKRNPAPSHAHQNLLRRAWEFYVNSHDEKDKPYGERGKLSEQYVRRIVAHRFGPVLNGGRVEKVQVRSATTPVAPPEWSNEKVNTQTMYRVAPWWTVTEEDFK